MDALADLPRRYPQVTEAWVGFSGGPDSTVLLYLAKRHLEAWKVRALHVDHGLHAKAEDWSAHCRRVCEKLDVSLTVLQVSLPAAPEDGLEAAAREARYSAIAERLRPHQAFLTAHHRDDQVETTLIQLLRGSGLRGLAGMPRERPIGQGVLLRPWLAIPRAELTRALESSGLPAIRDPMNHDPRFLRSRVRGELLPLLDSVRPGAGEAIARTAKLAGESTAVIEWAAERVLEDRIQPDGSLCLEEWRDLPLPVRAEVLRSWLSRLALPVPQRRQLMELLRQCDADCDREILVAWPGSEVRRFQGRLYATAPLRNPDAGSLLRWHGPALELPEGLGRLAWQPESGRDPAGPWPDLQVGFRTGGERI
ncbi:MAG: tRNA lysidine(34) synthetase TilS, partial [Xanthomonadales bacterium]|nr:tRNA lysidine(34) synthetase TilS [Xanthomonadales bacterium]